MNADFLKLLSSKPAASQADNDKMQRIVTMALAGFTLIGILWICFLSDTFSQASQVEPKDYAMEEARNLELAKQNRDQTSYDKLTDENAQQYVNDVADDTSEDEAVEEEEPVLPEVVETEPEGEEF